MEKSRQIPSFKKKKKNHTHFNKPTLLYPTITIVLSLNLPCFIIWGGILFSSVHHWGPGTVLYCLIFLAVWLKLLWTADPADPLWRRGCAEKVLITATEHWHWQGWKDARVQHCWASCNPALTCCNLSRSPREADRRKTLKTKCLQLWAQTASTAQVTLQLKVWWQVIGRPQKTRRD